jgi:hypothetical protein
MKIPSIFFQKIIHRFVVIYISLAATSALLAEHEANNIDPPIFITDVSWQYAELVTENSSCKASFPGIFVSLEDFDEVNDYIASEFNETFYITLITDDLNEISTAEELVKVIQAEEIEDRNDGFFDEGESVSVRILTDLPSNILYGVEVSSAIYDKVFHVCRIYKSISGKSYAQMAAGETILLEFFNTFEITP